MYGMSIDGADDLEKVASSGTDAQHRMETVSPDFATGPQVAGADEAEPSDGVFQDHPSTVRNVESEERSEDKPNLRESQVEVGDYDTKYGDFGSMEPSALRKDAAVEGDVGQAETQNGDSEGDDDETETPAEKPMGAETDDGPPEADLELITEELLSCVPEGIQRLFTLLDALVGVAEEERASDALLDVALSVMVDALFHSIDMGLMAPLARWLSTSSDAPEITAQVAVDRDAGKAHVHVRRDNEDILVRGRVDISRREVRRRALDHLSGVRVAEITIGHEGITVRARDDAGRIVGKAADIIRRPVSRAIDGQERSRAAQPPIWRRLSPSEARADAALLRTLRDIHVGRLSLQVRVRYSDLGSGRPLDPPEVLEVRPSGLPYPGVPDCQGEWWRALIERGWLRLPARNASPQKYLVSDAGKGALGCAP